MTESRLAQGLSRWRGRPIVAAVSGGSDSVALVRLLCDQAPPLDLKLTVAHMHHGVRGVEADADASFVETLAAGLGLRFELGRWTPERSSHFEADARRARYAWLSQIAASQGVPAAVAVGHTRDDQAETILHRILRGTGPRGLSGMPYARPLAESVTLIRPLLDRTRAELRDHLTALGQPWRDDATNADLSRTRARLRHELLPALARDYNPNVAEALVRLGRLTRAERSAVERWAARRAARVWHRDAEGRLFAELATLRAAPITLRAEVARAAWRAAGWPERAMDEAAWTRLAALAAGGGSASASCTLPGGYRAQVDWQWLTITPPASALPPVVTAPAWLPIPGFVSWGRGRLSVFTDRDRAGVGIERIDADAIEPYGPELSGIAGPALRVRAPEPGDRFAPLGLDGHTRRLVEFLRERGVPADRRAVVPLVCDQRGIVWVAGHRIAERARLKESTRRVLVLSVGEPAG